MARNPTFRERRASTNRELKQARASGVVVGVRPLVSANDCGICQAASKRVFPIKDCKVEMLPPYRDCELEGGCRASVSFVLEGEEPGRPRAGLVRRILRLVFPGKG
jgi:hypothetical protein